MLAGESRLNFQFLIPHLIFLYCYETIHFSPRLCKVAKCFSIVENIAAKFFNYSSVWYLLHQPIEGPLGFVQFSLGAASKLFTYFGFGSYLCCFLFSLRKVYVSKKLGYYFGRHCFALGCVTFNINKVNFLSKSACSLSSLFSWPEIL